MLIKFAGKCMILDLLVPSLGQRHLGIKKIMPGACLCGRCSETANLDILVK